MTGQATFRTILNDSSGTTEYDDVLSFRSADASGSFSLWAGHAEFIAVGVAGISCLRRRDSTLYLAASQLLIEFSDNCLYLSSRRLFSDSGRDKIGAQLQAWLQEQQRKREQQSLQAARFERELVQRLLQAARGEAG